MVVLTLLISISVGYRVIWQKHGAPPTRESDRRLRYYAFDIATALRKCTHTGE